MMRIYHRIWIKGGHARVDNEILEVDDPFERHSFSEDNCFVCGISLNDDNRTKEHIYPKWLQRKYNLYNQRLVLLNGTDIKYKDLTVPCCKKCNEIMSSKIENPMKKAVEGCYSEFIGLDRTIIFQWLNKLSYGMLYKEQSLRIDRSDKNSEMITNPEVLNNLKMKYMFLKTIISDAQFVETPFSLLIFEIDYNEQDPYWGHDGFAIPVFFMTLGDIGIISHMADNGYNEAFFKDFPDHKELLDYMLHPIQFRELCARFFYKSTLFVRDPAYTIILDGDQNPNVVISHGMSGIGYEDWDQEQYAQYLAHFLSPWGITFEHAYKENGLVISFIRNEDGSFKNIEI